MIKQINYSWSDFDADTIGIEQQLRYTGWIPDYIVGVKRGGLIPAIRLSHIFNKPLIMMSCQLRDSEDHEVRLYEVKELPKDKNVLIVDDICDSGETLQKITKELIANDFENIRTCSLWHNTAQYFKTDYTVNTIDRSKDTRWIIFPWEKTNDCARVA